MRWWFLATVLLTAHSACSGRTDLNAAQQPAVDPRAVRVLLDVEKTYADSLRYSDHGEVFDSEGVCSGVFFTNWRSGTVEFGFRDFGMQRFYEDRGFRGSAEEVVRWEAPAHITSATLSPEAPQGLMTLTHIPSDAIYGSKSPLESAAMATAGTTTLTSWFVPRLLTGVDVFECETHCVTEFEEEVEEDGVPCVTISLRDDDARTKVIVGRDDKLIRKIQRIDPAAPGIPSPTSPFYTILIHPSLSE